MDLSKTEALGFKIPTWQEALAQMLKMFNNKLFCVSEGFC